MLLISFKQLRSPSIRNVLQQREVWLWMLDEAHCISKLGHDFQPNYRYDASPRNSPAIMCPRSRAVPPRPNPRWCGASATISKSAWGGSDTAGRRGGADQSVLCRAAHVKGHQADRYPDRDQGEPAARRGVGRCGLLRHARDDGKGSRVFERRGAGGRLFPRRADIRAQARGLGGVSSSETTSMP